ncbi:hypothetical protein AYO46_05030 [Betaproteobacteria bacterium SCGC AG-212-J23]|nr:hypothetical protein AYO46_05030 [Betaproteobacteria bacterium SCGC AG-212-J23]
MLLYPAMNVLQGTPRIAARFLLTAFLLLAGCAPLQWTRPDATPEQTQADTADCQQRAWQESNFRSFGYGPGYRWSRYPFWGDRYYDETRLTRFCMEVRGYSLEAAPKQ